MDGTSTINDLKIPVEAENPGKCCYCGMATPPGLVECQDIEACKGMKIDQDENFKF